MSRAEQVARRTELRAPRFTMGNLLVGSAAILAACLTSIVCAVAVSMAYQLLAYGDIWRLQGAVGGGLAIGLLYAVPFIARSEYTIPAYLGGAHRPSRIFTAWNMAFVGLLVILFLTQTTLAVSRVTAVTFYAVGLLGMFVVESSIRSAVVAGLRRGALPARRIMLVGRRTALSEFTKRIVAAVPETERMGVRIVTTSELPERDAAARTDHAALGAALQQAVMSARTLLPDEVVLAGPWDDPEVIETVVQAFEQLPVAIHLDGGPVLGRFADVHLRRVGGTATLSVADVPLTPVQVILKRGLDIVGATVGLILLSPLFALIAIAIRRDSPGSALFTQERCGFNQRTFRIYKFRTMTTTDDGPVVRQATVGDARITRVGAFLRRTSLDELPQLLNVLKGDMSLVGPRPHAVAHDRTFERRIHRYPRRLNMKPGMTGWAQVNGLRGETDTDDKMRRRVEADLYYIDNWSVLLDLYIILLTVFSRRTFHNAR